MAAALLASLLLGLLWLDGAPGDKPSEPLLITPSVQTAGSTEADARNRRAAAPAFEESSERMEAESDPGDETTPLVSGSSGPKARTDSEAELALPPPAPSRGWLRIVVEPWGNVWIDGRYFGRAPVKARLPKGRHVIEAGREIPSKRRVVRVQPGARKEVDLRLDAE